jgi:RNA recognition motif-containing protein
MSGKSGSVVLFLRNLPIDFSRQDLKKFVQSELKKAGIRGTPLRSPCSNYTVLRITDRSSGTREYHGLVEIQPARIAMQAMEVLNGKMIAGKPVEVRRYRHRSPWGRHAAQGEQTSAEDFRVAIESRRQNIQIEVVDDPPGTPMADRVPALR